MMRSLKNSHSIIDGNQLAAWAAPAGNEADDRGVALVITLLLLFLLSIIGLAAVLSTSSDMLINGYYANSRGSFYAADSGVNIARQTLQNGLGVSVGACPSCTCPATPGGAFVGPVVSGLGQTIMNQIVAAYGNNTPIAGTSAANQGVAGNSWGESFKLVSTGTTIAPSTITIPPTCVNGVPSIYEYVYNYTITAVGTATGNEQATVTDNGSIIVSINVTQSSTQNVSYAYYGAFITNYAQCLGPLVPGTMTGPMFTDGEWGFMPGGQYIFTDPVGQQDGTASFFDSNWNCYQSATSPFTAPNGQVIAPQFQEGFNVGLPSVTQPPDSFSQEWAVLDSKGCGENGNVCGVPTSPSPGTPTSAQLSANLLDINGNPYPSTGATSGVFMNYQTGPPATMNGGGFYVEGNASIQLSPSGASAQVYTITQGTAPTATTTTITVDPLANGGAGSTVVQQSGASTLTLSGVPMNLSNPANVQQGTMIYVNGTVASLSGPGEGMGAIQDGANVTITALGDVNLTGDVRYKTEPVTTASNQTAGTPPTNYPQVDSLIPSNDKNQDLGIFTANGSIYMSTSYADGNLQVDGSQAVIGSQCQSSSCGFYVGNSCPNGHCQAWPAGGNYQGGCINTFNNVGGQIQTNIFGACLGVENTYYDRRYNTKPNFAPPWFPGTTITTANTIVVGSTQTTLQRTSWLSSSGQ